MDNTAPKTCECGCGEPVKPKRRFKQGHWVKSVRWSGPDNPSWKGGRQVDAKGYILIPDGKGGREKEHRIVARQANLLTDETMDIHHIDGNPSNNDPGNLRPMTRSEHVRHHAILRGQDPEFLEKASAIQIETWTDPEIRAKRLAGMNDPVSKAAMKESSKRTWANQTPETTKQRMAGIKWEDMTPEAQEQRMAGFKKAAALRRGVPTNRARGSDGRFHKD